MTPGTRGHLRNALLGTALTGLTAAVARRRAVHPRETGVFRAVNELPNGLHRPVYVVMQGGSLAAVYVTAGLAATRGKRALAGTIAVSGTCVWAGCKVVKRWVGRGRPTAHVDDVTIRGSEEGGLGFPSGHSAVATTLAVIVAGELPAAAKPVLYVTAGTVALARVYVGAHLPLDIVGGIAIGIASGSLTRLAIDGPTA
jgi:membrane-associated phospholipid phosphatase